MQLSYLFLFLNLSIVIFTWDQLISNSMVTFARKSYVVVFLVQITYTLFFYIIGCMLLGLEFYSLHTAIDLKLLYFCVIGIRLLMCKNYQSLISKVTIQVLKLLIPIDFSLLGEVLYPKVCHLNKFDELIKLNKNMDDCLIKMQRSAQRLKDAAKKVVLLENEGGGLSIEIPHNSSLSAKEERKIHTGVQNALLTYDNESCEYMKLLSKDKEINNGGFQRDFKKSLKDIQKTYSESIAKE